MGLGLLPCFYLISSCWMNVALGGSEKIVGIASSHEFPILKTERVRNIGPLGVEQHAEVRPSMRQRQQEYLLKKLVKAEAEHLPGIGDRVRDDTADSAAPFYPFFSDTQRFLSPDPSVRKRLLESIASKLSRKELSPSLLSPLANVQIAGKEEVLPDPGQSTELRQSQFEQLMNADDGATAFEEERDERVRESNEEQKQVPSTPDQASVLTVEQGARDKEEEDTVASEFLRGYLDKVDAMLEQGALHTFPKPEQDLDAAPTLITRFVGLPVVSEGSN